MGALENVNSPLAPASQPIANQPEEETVCNKVTGCAVEALGQFSDAMDSFMGTVGSCFGCGPRRQERYQRVPTQDTSVEHPEISQPTLNFDAINAKPIISDEELYKLLKAGGSRLSNEELARLIANLCKKEAFFPLEGKYPYNPHLNTLSKDMKIYVDQLKFYIKQ